MIDKVAFTGNKTFVKKGSQVAEQGIQTVVKAAMDLTGTRNAKLAQEMAQVVTAPINKTVYTSPFASIGEPVAAGTVINRTGLNFFA